MVDILDDFQCYFLTMSLIEVIANPCNQVIFEYAFN